MVTAGSFGVAPANTSEIVMVFKQFGKVTSTFSKVATGYPADADAFGGIMGAFGGMCEGRILVGHGRNVYEYKMSEDKWIPFQENVDYDRLCATGCTMHSHLSDMYLLLCGGKLKSRVELLPFRKDDIGYRASVYSSYDAMVDSNKVSRPSVLKRNAVHFVTPTKLFNEGSAKRILQTFCQTKLPLDLYTTTITTVSNNKVLLAGGDITNVGVTNRVFIGELIADKRDVLWKEVESMKTKRRWHMAFKMNHSVYVVGGHSGAPTNIPICERFDLKESKWYKCKYNLSYDLYSASVVVSADESFALITGGTSGSINGKTNGIIIFTESSGFVVLWFSGLKNSSLLSRRTNHVSIRIT